MREKIINEIIIAIAFGVLLLLLVNPWYFWMPDTITYATIAVLFVLAGLFIGLALKSAPQDEREESHLLFASRTAYFSGMIILLAGVSYQALTNHVDPWLAGVLAVMIIAKVLGHAWAKRYR